MYTYAFFSSFIDKRKLRIVSIIGIGIAIYYIIFPLFYNKRWEFSWTFSLLNLSNIHISIMLLINDKTKNVLLCKMFTIILALIIDIMILVTIWNLYTPSVIYNILLSILKLLVILSTIGTPLLSYTYKNM